MTIVKPIILCIFKAVLKSIADELLSHTHTHTPHPLKPPHSYMPNPHLHPPHQRRRLKENSQTDRMITLPPPRRPAAPPPPGGAAPHPVLLHRSQASSCTSNLSLRSSLHNRSLIPTRNSRFRDLRPARSPRAPRELACLRSGRAG